MVDGPRALPAVESELLVATCTPTGEVVTCNAAWRSVMGTRSAPWAHLSPDDTQVAHESVLRAARGSLVTNQIVSAQTPVRDEPFPVLLHFVPVHRVPDNADAPDRAPDGPVGVGLRHDAPVMAVTVTGEVMAEPTSWIVNQTQRHRMEALGRMTMGVAHDLNNLLSSLLGHLELLRALPRLDSEPAGQSLRTIERAAEDGAALIGKLQRYIRQDTEVHFEPVDVAELLEDCIALTQPYWHNEPRRQGIRITVGRHLRDVPPVLGSASELREVFINLILNAVQAMPEGGHLHFATYADGNEVCVEVADTGQGMAEAVRERIFEPLFTTKGSQGTGMGLSASYGIVQEHSGRIDVDTAPGEGTTFTLAFPRLGTEAAASAAATPTASPEAPARPGTPEAAPPEAAPPEPTPVRVLVVDDEPMVRSVAMRLLRLRGHAVEGAASGPDALDRLGACMDHPAEAFDLVFTDFGMPEMNGADLARHIRARWPHLPVVLLTGYTETDGTEGVVDATVSKPFKLEALEAQIRALVPQASADDNGA